MKNFSLSVVSDTVFSFICLFLISLSLMARVIKTPYSVIFSVMLSLLLSLAVFKFLSAKKSRSAKKREEKEKAEEIMLQLAFMQKAETSSLFYKTLSMGGQEVKKRKSLLVLSDKREVYSLCFNIDGLKKADAVKLYNALKEGEKGKIFCSFCDKETLSFCSRFKGRISVADGNQTYRFLKEKNSLPEIKFRLLNEKPKKFYPDRIFNKKRALNYFVFGLCFAFLSFIVRYNVYYIVAGCAFLLLAAVSVIFGKKEKT